MANALDCLLSTRRFATKRPRVSLKTRGLKVVPHRTEERTTVYIYCGTVSAPSNRVTIASKGSPSCKEVKLM